jgi:glycosyltransferase involved in cell wall biosynthesis
MEIIYSIVIVNHKTLNLISRCLNSIQENSKDSAYEIIVVDNNSADESLAYLKQQNNIKLIERVDGLHYGPQDHGESIDIGMAETSGKYLVVMDSDVAVICDGWLEQLSDILEKEKAVLVGSSLYRNFIHVSFLMLKKCTLERYNLHFRAFKRFHEYFDTGEYITHILRNKGERIINLPAWVPGKADNCIVEFIDGNNTFRWQEYWLPLVAKYGVIMGKFAFHGFFGTFVQVNDIYGMREGILNRDIDIEKLNHVAGNYVFNYDLLVDKHSTLAKISTKITWVIKASVYCGLSFAVSVRNLFRKISF